MADEIISIRKFAKLNNISDTTIHKMIKADKIVHGLVQNDKGKPAINRPIAQAEYDSWAGGSHSSNYVGGPRSNKNVTNAPASKDAKPAREPESTVMKTAKQAQAVYAAKTAELEFKRKFGELVDRQKVYKQLYQLGDVIKSTMRAIPSRTTASIRAAKTQNEGQNILSEEIDKGLEKIVELYNKINIE